MCMCDHITKGLYSLSHCVKSSVDVLYVLKSATTLPISYTPSYVKRLDVLYQIK